MPDHANARLAARRLVAHLVVRSQPARNGEAIDALLAELDADEAADLQLVLDALDDGQRDTRGRFVFAVTERDFQTAGARRVVIIDTERADGHQGYEAEYVASLTSEAKARTIVDTMNEHPPAVPPPPLGYDEEPF